MKELIANLRERAVVKRIEASAFEQIADELEQAHAAKPTAKSAKPTATKRKKTTKVAESRVTEIVDALRDAAKPMSVVDLAVKVGRSRAATSRVVTHLARTDTVRVTGYTPTSGRGRGAPLYMLSTEHAHFPALSPAQQKEQQEQVTA